VGWEGAEADVRGKEGKQARRNAVPLQFYRTRTRWAGGGGGRPRGPLQRRRRIGAGRAEANRTSEILLN
jgi:hypothetical protein